MKYISLEEAAKKWNLKTNEVEDFCERGLIPGAATLGNLWIIPTTTTITRDNLISDVSFTFKNEDDNFLQSLNRDDNNEVFKQIIKDFPYPMHICSPDGIIRFVNDEFLKFAKITHPERLYGKHNIKSNPNLELWGIKDFVMRAFRGEPLQVFNVKVPLREVVEDLGDEKDLVYGVMYQDMTAFPIRDNKGKLTYVGFIFIISKYYQGKEEIIRGKEYIDEHWNVDYDADKLSEVVHISKYHYSRLFKQYIGMTPHNYYRSIKIANLKHLLCNTNLSITRVFDKCGIIYNGNTAQMIKKELGMTPTKYRTKMSAESIN